MSAPAESEKPTLRSTVGVQAVTVTSTMKHTKNAPHSSSVFTARPSVNRCLTGMPSRSRSGEAMSSASAGISFGAMRESVWRTSSRRMLRAIRKRSDSGSHAPSTAVIASGTMPPM